MSGVFVLNTNTERKHGRKVQIDNITAARTVSELIRTCLGPRSMLKMLLDPMGGIVMTNDGNAILREVHVTHPAAKSMIELARTQDEEVGDGTTSVIIIAGEMLATTLPLIEKEMHPTVIISAYHKAMEDAVKTMEKIATKVNIDSDEEMLHVIKSTLGTKMIAKWNDLMCSLALKAVRTVAEVSEDGRKTIDIKRYARIEKIPGGEVEDCKVLDGVMLNKDVTHPKMRRRIENPRIILLDCPLEYKKGESQTDIEVSKAEDWNKILELEEKWIEEQCNYILALKPDLVITEKGLSDLAQHYFIKKNVTCLRRVRKTDNNRIARACGANIVNRPDELKESDVGTGCGLYHVEKIGDEYFSFIVECKNAKACTMLLRGASKDFLNEVERNLHDAMNVARNVYMDPRLLPGGGATEMAIVYSLNEKAKSLEGVQQWPYKAVGDALEVIPRTLVQNSGATVIRVLTQLRAKHAEGLFTWGINGEEGTIADMKTYGVWETMAVKAQTIKTAIEAASMLLRVDDVVSGLRKKGQDGGAAGPSAEDQETFGDARDG